MTIWGGEKKKDVLLEFMPFSKNVFGSQNTIL
jgi:hypothetical protein